MKNDHTFIINYVIQGFINRILLGAASVICLFFILNGDYFVIFFIIPLLILTFAYKAITLNFITKTYFFHHSILGWKTGVKRKLPKMQYLLIKDKIFISHDEDIGTSQYRCYEVSLMCEDKIKIELFYGYSKNDVRKFIRKYEKLFNCPIKDLTKEKII